MNRIGEFEVGSDVRSVVRKIPHSAPFKVIRDESGKMINVGEGGISVPHIPLGRRDVHGNWIPYSKDERINMAAKEERSKMRALKKEAIERSETPSNLRRGKPIMSFIGDMKAERRMVRERKRNIQTVRRAGKYVQSSEEEVMGWEATR